jgi:hypothetical protein
MCPVLSLANRAFLAFLGTLLAFTSLPTQAEELQFGLTGTAFTATNPSTLVGPFNVSFMLDTLSGTSSTAFSQGCLSHFGVSGGVVTNMLMTAGNQTWAPIGPVSGGYGGDIGRPDVTCPGLFFAALVVRDATHSLTFEAGIPTVSQTAFLQNPDPFAPLLEEFTGSYLIFANEGSGSLEIDFNHVTVTPVSVPEPGVFGLLLLGFAGVVLCGRKRISVRAPALSA